MVDFQAAALSTSAVVAPCRQAANWSNSFGSALRSGTGVTVDMLTPLAPVLSRPSCGDPLKGSDVIAAFTIRL